MKTNGNKTLIKRFLPYFKKYRWILILDLVCAAFSTACDLIFPLIVRYVTDIATDDLQRLTFKLIISVTLIYMIISVFNALANYYMTSIGHIMGTKIEIDMRKDLFSHIQKLPFAYFNKTKTGDLMSRITNDLFEVTEFAHHCPEEFFIAFIKIVGSFIILSFINLPLTLIIFLSLPFLFVFSWYYNKKMKKAFKKSKENIGDLNAQIEDSLSGIRVVKSFANEKIEDEKFEKGNEMYLSIKRVMYKAIASFNSGVKIFDRFIYIAVVAVGAVFIKFGHINAGDLVAYLLYISTLLLSIMRIVEFTEQFQKGMTGIERFTEIMDIEADIKDKEDSIELKAVKGEIEFKHVDFKYDDGTENILTDINLKVEAGQNIALVGPSGVGKSTICNLISRFYDVTSGGIYLDKINIKEIKGESLHKNIGIVQQEVYLFSGTVLENIEYGKPGATREEIITAAKRAGAHEFIMSLENGYDTFVGQKGVRLSGGEKQRLSIARVFLKNPPILILDEATSALDNRNEKIVKESLDELSKGRTTFTIAHRLTTIKSASKILVLTQNGIEEQGTHKELLQKKGLYWSFYNMYTE